MHPLSKLVSSGTSLNQLVKQLSAHEALVRQIRQLLPSPLDSQLMAVVLQQGNLTLFVSSPVWASRFRYLLPQLQKQLSSHGIPLARLRTHILPNADTKAVKTRQPDRRPMLSQSAAKHIRETAKAITDPSLKAALERLGRHTEQS